MSNIGIRYRQYLQEQTLDTKFNQLLNQNKQIQSIKHSIIVPQGISNNEGKLQEIKKQKIKIRIRSMSEKKIINKKLERVGKSKEKKQKNEKKEEVGLGKLKVQRSKSSKMLQKVTSNSKSLLAKKEIKSSIEKSGSKKHKTQSLQRQQKSVSFLPPSQKHQLHFISQQMQKISQKNKITNLPESISHNSKTIIKLSNEQIDSMMLHIKFGRIQQNITYKKYIKNKNIQNSQKILNNLQKWLQKYKIKNGLINIKNLQNIFNKKYISNHSILSLFYNYQQLKKQFINIIPGLKFYSNNHIIGQNLAAKKIQSFFKMITNKKYTKKLQIINKNVIIIQKHWRNALNYKKFRSILIQKANKKITLSHQITNKFMENWQLIKTSRKIQIHICSIALEQFKRLTIQNLHLRELSQITRIFKSIETDCIIIYVIPINLAHQIINYYERLFALVNKIDVFRDRLYIISVQQTLYRICPHLTTISALLYDSKTLNKIRNKIKQKQNELIGQTYAYIIPSYPSNQYINLSAQLQIPLFSGCQSLSKFYSTKSGCYQLLKPIHQHLKNECPFLLPLSVCDIYSEKQLINTLAILIYSHQFISKWILKIDDEVNGRGLALFNIDTLDFLKYIRNKQQHLTNDKVHKSQNIHQISDKQIIQIIADQLKIKLKTKLIIIHPNIYPNYDSYLSHFLTRGGIIQECIESDHHANTNKPTQHSISFRIEPNGQFSILTTYTKLQLNYKSISQSIQCPSNLSTSLIDNQKIIRTLYRYIWSKFKLFGYFTVDCLYSQIKKIGSIYIIGIDCFLNQKTCSIFLPIFTSQMKYDKETNQHYTNLVKEQNKSQYVEKFKRNTFKSQTNNTNAKQSEQNLQKTEFSQQKQQTHTQPIHFIYCPLLKIKNISQTMTFFKQCKYNNIQFDIKQKKGTLFLLEKGLQNQCIGLISINKSKQIVYQQILKFINFLFKQYKLPFINYNKNIYHQYNTLGQIKTFISIQQKTYNQSQLQFKKQNINLQFIF